MTDPDYCEIKKFTASSGESVTVTKTRYHVVMEGVDFRCVMPYNAGDVLDRGFTDLTSSALDRFYTQTKGEHQARPGVISYSLEGMPNGN